MKAVKPTCYHCKLAVPANSKFSMIINAVEEFFCCPACLAITEMIYNNKLELFYQQRDGAHSPPEMNSHELTEITSYDDPSQLAALSAYKTIIINKKSYSELILSLQGITCAACGWLIEACITTLPGVQQISVNLTTNKAVLRWDNEQIKLSRILKKILKLGYKAFPYESQEHESLLQQEERQALIRIGVAFLGSMQVMMFAVGLYLGSAKGMLFTYKYFLQVASLIITTPIIYYAGRHFFRKAYLGLKNFNLGMDASVSIAILCTYIASLLSIITHSGEVYFDSICMFILLLNISQYLEFRSRKNTSKHCHNLSQLIPRIATVVSKDENHKHEQVLTKKLRDGDIVHIKTNEAIPVDGKIIAGKTLVDEALLTGEAKPISKTSGDLVIGGSINIDQPILVKVTNKDHSFVDQLNSLIERGLSEKPHTVGLANKIASYFSLTVLLIAGATLLYWHNHLGSQALWISASVLIVACPCALSLATPTALAISTFSLAKQGLLITKANALEELAKITHVIFDKTGTLTLGQFTVTQVVPVADIDKDDCFAIASALELSSAHPIAYAFKQNPLQLAYTVTNEQHSGEGVAGIINNICYRIGKPEFVTEIFTKNKAKVVTPSKDHNWILLGSDAGAIAWFQVQDRLNNSAGSSINKLKQLGISCQILSGDNLSATKNLAQSVGIETYSAEATPEQKQALCQQLQQRGNKILMIGDGVNDTPALAIANSSICMANNNDLNQRYADAILLNKDLRLIATAILVAKRTKKIIKISIIWAIVYNAVAIGLAAGGLVQPYLAAIGMASSSLLVMANSLRLKRIPGSC